MLTLLDTPWHRHSLKVTKSWCAHVIEHEAIRAKVGGGRSARRKTVMVRDQSTFKVKADAIVPRL
jgi:hypothetical protein